MSRRLSNVTHRHHLCVAAANSADKSAEISRDHKYRWYDSSRNGAGCFSNRRIIERSVKRPTANRWLL